ncbi:MAG: formylglycine-generating enzyme family protein [Verrucomicrobiales bacterium]
MKALTTLVIALGIVSVSEARIDVELLSVGTSGNAADTEATPPRGAVSIAYRIGKYEVTNAEYAAFLNAVAAQADPNGLFQAAMAVDPRGGISRTLTLGVYRYSTRSQMSNKPVNFVSYFDACRFCNWLHNNQPTGAQSAATTEDGVYLMNAAVVPARKTGARFFLPTHDEWHKAAYHDPANASADSTASANYWNFPTVSDLSPSRAAATPTGDCANPGPHIANFADGADWNGQNGHVVTVGSCESASFYGAHDMIGNVSEWVPSTTSPGSAHLLGGSFRTAAAVGKSDALPTANDGTFENADVGFRLAARFAPTSICLVDVGDAENAAYSGPGSSSGRGAVSKVYSIGQYEITNGDYIGFLNSVAKGLTSNGDPHGLYDPSMEADPRGGIDRVTVSNLITNYIPRSNMGDKPVNFVSYYDALRFC